MRSHVGTLGADGGIKRRGLNEEREDEEADERVGDVVDLDAVRRGR